MKERLEKKLISRTGDFSRAKTVSINKNTQRTRVFYYDRRLSVNMIVRFYFLQSRPPQYKNTINPNCRDVEHVFGSFWRNDGIFAAKQLVFQTTLTTYTCWMKKIVCHIPYLESIKRKMKCIVFFLALKSLLFKTNCVIFFMKTANSTLNANGIVLVSDLSTAMLSFGCSRFTTSIVVINFDLHVNRIQK